MNRMLRVIVFTGSALALPVFFAAQVPHAPVVLQSPVQDKNFYVLSLIERTPAAVEALARDPELTALGETKWEATEQAAGNCNKPKADCIVDISHMAGAEIDAALFTPAEIDTAGKHLQQIYKERPAVRALLAGAMRRSGFFELYRHDTDETLLAHAWVDAAHSIDQILQTYGMGVAPRYPKIDSPSFNVNSPAGSQLIHSVAAQKPMCLFFEPSLHIALGLLEVNHRDEAGRFEPLETGVNAAALRRLAGIKWSDYRYTVIVVPGEGPEEPGVNLSHGSRTRIALAVKDFQAGLAPLILVSGGFVHPSQTKFCEAIEMKKALIRDFGIPANVILAEPHARHTTTNLRNATRLIYRYGIPFDKPALIVTDTDQSASIESTSFVDQSKTNLGYVPYKSLTRISPTDLSFLPEIDSLQANARDPLDP
jgi:hypothetical protein